MPRAQQVMRARPQIVGRPASPREAPDGRGGRQPGPAPQCPRSWPGSDAAAAGQAAAGTVWRSHRERDGAAAAARAEADLRPELVAGASRHWRHRGAARVWWHAALPVPALHLAYAWAGSPAGPALESARPCQVPAAAAQKQALVTACACRLPCCPPRRAELSHSSTRMHCSAPRQLNRSRFFHASGP
jgi:hypothetical protein